MPTKFEAVICTHKAMSVRTSVHVFNLSFAREGHIGRKGVNALQEKALWDTVMPSSEREWTSAVTVSIIFQGQLVLFVACEHTTKG
ncbi:hypothetical protein FKM82_013468 [Ascaphus truei]